MDDRGHAQAIALGLTRRQFDYWCRLGLVYDDDSTAPGTGFARRRLRKAEVERLQLMAELVQAGVAPAAASRLARDLRRDGHATLGSMTLTRNR